MNRERDFDHTLRTWLEDGADHAPERFIWAALYDVERSAQRGAWRVPLEELLMKFKPAALVLGTAAVIVLAVAAYQLFAGPNVSNPGPSPTPTPRVYEPEDLPNIVLTDANAPDGFIVDGTVTGANALSVPIRPGGPFVDDSAFVDALMTNLNSTETGGYVSWSALFETTADAEVAFDYFANEHQSADGWGMEPSTVNPGLGDESVTFTGAAYDLFETGAAYDLFETNITHLWRVGNLVLAAVAVGDLAVGEENATQLLTLAELMDEYAQ